MGASEPAPAVGAWQPWAPTEIAARLTGVGVPWCVVGGWSIDLFVGRTTRLHGDLEIAITREHFPAIRRALDGLRFHGISNGRTRLLPDHTEPPDAIHQIWVHEPTENVWRVDVMLEPGDDLTWRFRRRPTIAAPRADMAGTTPDGIPYLRPQGTLLYKAKALLPKDQLDFDAAVPLMAPPARAWLADAIGTHLRPQHPWIDALTA